MDYVTRQFINLAKKFRKESRKALVELKDAIDKNTKATQKSAEAHEKQAQANSLVLSAINTQQSQVHEYRTRDESRNPMEWIKLAVAIGTLVVVAAYTALTAYQLIQLKVSADTAKVAADTAKKQLEMSERPWMSAEFSIEQPIEFQANGDMGVRVHVVMKNIGHSVATDVRLILGADSEGRGLWFMEVPKEQKEMCDNWRNFPSSGNGGSTTLFPGEGAVEDDSFIVTKEQLRKVEAEVSGKTVITGLALFGCVNYGFAFAPERHQTGFSYDLIKPAPRPKQAPKFGEAVGGALYMNLGENVPVSQLKIRRSIFGGFYVD